MKAAKMAVQLVSFTQDAEDLLLFTKSTRLNMTPNLFQEIKQWSPEKKLAELEYMANTVPSSWEFCDYVFLITGVSRAFTHQLVRTRTGSYAQQAMRVVKMTEYEYVYPPSMSREGAFICAQANAEINNHYNTLLEMGEKTEDARGILPTNIATNIMAKFNLRSLADLVRQRTGGRVQDEYRGVANAMADEVLKVHPWAQKFLFQKDRDFYKEAEDFANGLEETKRLDLLKIIHHMRKGTAS